MKQVSDNQDLLKYLDKHFSILDHEPFLAQKFPGTSEGYHTTTEDGDTNYFATSFSNFADKWLRSLKDLRQGGWDDTHRDLKQAFVNASEAHPIFGCPSTCSRIPLQVCSVPNEPEGKRRKASRCHRQWQFICNYSNVEEFHETWSSIARRISRFLQKRS